MKKLLAVVTLFMCFVLQAQNVTDDKTGTVFTISQVDKAPEYPGGEMEFLKCTHRNMRIPDFEIGVVLNIGFGFIVETDGSVSNAMVTTDIPEDFKQEVLRAVNECNKTWKPAVKNKAVVRCVYEKTFRLTVKGDD